MSIIYKHRLTIISLWLKCSLFHQFIVKDISKLSRDIKRTWKVKNYSIEIQIFPWIFKCTHSNTCQACFTKTHHITDKKTLAMGYTSTCINHPFYIQNIHLHLTWCITHLGKNSLETSKLKLTIYIGNRMRYM